jgi:hypothetical protein
MGFLAGMVLASSVQGQVFLTNGLVAYYPLNGNANDASGNGNNGTTNDVKYVTNQFNVPNGAIQFNGGSSAVTVPASSSLNLTDSFTLSGWLSSKSLNQSVSGLIAKGGSSIATISWMARWGDEESHFSLWLGNGGTYQEFLSKGSYNFGTGTWEAFLVSFNITNGTVNIYTNGNLDSTYTTTLKPNSTPNGVLMLGNQVSFNGNQLVGCLDDIRIYNRALSTNEVQAVYQFESGEAQLVSASPALQLNTTNLAVGGSYQIQTSSDLINWTNYGTTFIATATNAPQYVGMTSLQGFYRIEPAP